MWRMLSWGRVRRAVHPLFLRFWLRKRSLVSVKTRVAGFELEVFPMVFHPRYFGSSAILAKFVSALPLAGKSFLDVGSGSGLIAMCAARGGADVVAVDINEEAVRCTLANAGRHELKIKARVSDLFSTVDNAKFDAIAFNPPFLLGTAQSPAETAFYGGLNFDVIRKFAADVRTHLRPGGSIYMILSSDIDLAQIERIFLHQDFKVSRMLAVRWLLGETMVILCAQ
jgi:release factor glutamine methyltransferase